MSRSDLGPLETVERFFSAKDRQLLAGVLAEWTEWDERVPDPPRLVREVRFEGCDLVEETETRAVVEVRASTTARLERGTWEWRMSYDGPAVLERVDDAWRIVDYTVDGQSRAESVVLGPLAEQEHDGITVRAVGVERGARATSVVFEVANATTTAVRCDRALILMHGVWRRASLQGGAAEPGGAAVVGLASATTVSPTQDAIVAGLRVRSGRSKHNFLLHVPLMRPSAPFRRAPPRRLPFLHDTRAQLGAYALMTAVFAWLAGWFALIVPVFLALVYWRHARAVGWIPPRLYPFRYLLDALIVGGCLAVTWWSPAAELTMTIAVGLAVYGFLGLVRTSDSARVLIALSAATGWLAVLGGPTDRLSPCRIADGSPAATADRFARAIFSGDLTDARRLYAHRNANAPYTKLLPVGTPLTALASRRNATHTRVCTIGTGLGVTDCYSYRTRTRAQLHGMWVGVGCQSRHWRIEFAV